MTEQGVIYTDIETAIKEHEDILKAIKLFGREVAPKVRAYFENK